MIDALRGNLLDGAAGNYGGRSIIESFSNLKKVLQK